jgi:anti-anti-sigma regulatory factor
MSAPVVERPAVPGRASSEVVVPFDEVLRAGGLADARWLLHDALLSGARTVVVDLSRVPQLPPGSLATFVWAHRICRARGGGVVLRGAGPGVTGSLQRTGLWRVLAADDAPVAGHAA